MRALLALLSLLVFAAGCTHRPRYKELVAAAGVTTPAEGSTVPVALVDPNSGEPLPGVKVQFGDRKRVSLTTDEKGRIEVPVSKDLEKDNPLVEVNRAKGGGYKLAAVIVAPAPAPVPATEPEPAPATP